VVTGAEVSAAGIYVKNLFSDTPEWVTAAVVTLALLTANLISVKLFGEFEFWFFLIKVVMNILVIALGLSIILSAFGVELVGITASEAKNPEKVLAACDHSVALRIAVFASARSSHAID
jgi:L-asparagine transporter-like permease